MGELDRVNERQCRAQALQIAHEQHNGPIPADAEVVLADARKYYEFLSGKVSTDG